MSDKFIVAAVEGINPPPMPFKTRQEALEHARTIFENRGGDIEIAIYLNWLSPGDVWLGAEQLREWYRAGCPSVS